MLSKAFSFSTRTLLFSYLLLLHSQLSIQYLNTGEEIRDLFNGDSCIASDVASWTVSTLAGTSKTTTCNGYTLVGGYNILATPQMNGHFTRTYNDLPSHTYIYFSITGYAIDTWDDTRSDNDRYQLSFDTTDFIALQGLPSRRFFEYLCGVPTSADLANIRIFGRVAHMDTKLVLTFMSLMGEASTNESFGFREISLLFLTPSTAPGNALCVSGPGPMDVPNKCTCIEGQYDNSGTCTTCHANCASCFGGTASQCYQCKPGYSLVGSTCTACHSSCSVCHGSNYNECDQCNEGYFLINKNQCILQCQPPLVQVSTACAETCESPCSDVNDFVYWDGSCSATCDSPLHQYSLVGSLKGCSYPCTSAQFLLSNGKCTSTCDSPMIPSSIRGRKLCSFPCPAGQYLYWDGSCSSECTYPLTQQMTDGNLYCQYTCTGTDLLYWDAQCRGTCPSPLVTRTDKGALFCDFPSTETDEYLYWDGSLSSSCDLPLVSRTVGSPIVRNFCDYKCNGDEFLTWDGVCSSTCDFPLQQEVRNGKNFCIYPCESTEFLYWDGACKSSCPIATFTPRTEAGGEQYCDFKCSNTNYLYWDSTCLPTCPPPLTVTNISAIGGKSCNYGCANTEFLYWNGSCKTSCDSPFTSSLIKGKQLCDYPCNAEDFLYYNGLCLPNCQLPLKGYKLGGRGYCDYPCSSTEFLFWNGSCISSCELPMTTQDGPNDEHYCNVPCPSPLDYYDVESGQCVKECSESSRVENSLYLRCLPGASAEDVGLVDEFLLAQGSKSVSLLVVPPIVQYVKYLKIQQSSRLESLVVSQSRPILYLRFGIAIPDSLTTWFAKQPLPAVYERTGLHSSFFVNYWADFTSLAIIVLVAIPLTIFTMILRRTQLTTVYLAFEKLKVLVKMNFLLMLMATHVGDIILYTALEFKTLSMDNASASASLAMNIAILILTVLFLISGPIMIRKYMKVKRGEVKDMNPPTFLKKWEGWQTLYRGFREDHWTQQSFYVIYTMRLLLSGLFSAVFVELPQTQTACQLLLNAGIIAFVLYANPIKKTINHVQLLILEGLFFVINFSAFLIAAFDKAGATNYGARVFLGDAILISSLLANLVPLVFLGLKLISETFSIYKFQKTDPNKDKTVWLKLLVIPLQQCAFGFEEVLEHTALPPKPMDKLKLLRNQEENYAINGGAEMDEKSLRKIANPFLTLGPQSGFETPSASPLTFNGEKIVAKKKFDRIDRLKNLRRKSINKAKQNREVFEEAKEEEILRIGPIIDLTATMMASPTDMTASTIIENKPRKNNNSNTNNHLNPYNHNNYNNNNYNNNYNDNYNNYLGMNNMNNMNNNGYDNSNHNVQNSNYLDSPTMVSMGSMFRDASLAPFINQNDTVIQRPEMEMSPLRRVIRAHEDFERQQRNSNPSPPPPEEPVKERKERSPTLKERFASQLNNKSKTQVHPDGSNSSLVMDQGSPVIKPRNLGRSGSRVTPTSETNEIKLD